MKKLIVLSVCLFFGLTLNAQENEVEIGNNFYFISTLNKELSRQKINLENKSKSIDDEIVKQNYKVKVVDIKEGKVYFKYLAFEEGSLLHGRYNAESDGDYKIFSIPEEEFTKLTEKYYNLFRGFRYGAYSVPIRLRGDDGNFEFDNNLSLGANIIARVGLRKFKFWYIDFSLGLSLSKVNLNPENSLLGKIGSDFEEIEALSPAALTISLGALINLAKNVNAGFYLGWDHLSSADNKADWRYNRKPWLGLGINVSFSEADKSGGSGNNKPN